MRVLQSLLPTLVLTFTAPAFGASAVFEGTGTPAATSSSINPAAQQGKKSQDSGSMMNMMMGVAMLAMCAATTPPNIPMCMMGAMAMAQGGADKDAASQSGATQMASSTTGATGTNAASTGTNANTASVPTYAAIDDTSASLKDKAAAKAGLSALSDAGYKASANGITSSNGTTIPPSAFNSSGGMTAAGLDPDQSKAAQEAAAKVGSDLSKYKGQAAVAEGVGGGGGSGPTGDSSSSSSSDTRKPGFVNPFAMTDQAKTALIAGKTVSFDGEPIGVKGDNIFDMVHSAYVRKTAGKHFIETDHDPDLNTVRAPASLPKISPRK